MSEYNIQMNKYNALNAEYDQLYPQPMKHASTHAKDGDDPITPSSIGAAELGADGKVLASQVDAYSKEESISAETRTALGLAMNATPDAALAEIARQLSEKMTILWKNASPSSSFASQTITLLSNSHRHFLVVPTNGYPILIRPGQTGRFTFVSGNQGGQSGTMTIMTRLITASSQTSITFSDAKDGNGSWSVYNNNCIPHFVYGIDGIPV